MFSDNHFKSRSIEKNALAISSKQSEEISSYDLVKKNYNNSLNKGNLDKRPEYWEDMILFFTLLNFGLVKIIVLTKENYLSSMIIYGEKAFCNHE